MEDEQELEQEVVPGVISIMVSVVESVVVVLVAVMGDCVKRGRLWGEVVEPAGLGFRHIDFHTA